MKKFAKSKGKRITAALLCAVMCIMSLPLSAFAFTAEEGKTVDAYYGDRYFGSDGDYYYSPESHQYIAYDENGNTSLHSASGVHRRTKLMIKDSSGSRQIMCIESGIDYNAGGTYSSVNGKNSSYFQNLPTTAQYGIMLTSVYGWRPGTTAPISGTNEDDFSMATQTILWEYQQQLRTSPTTLKANSYGVPADTYYQCIKGRPAEKCYDWLLTQMQSHATIPSFASNKSSSATTYTLKYNQAADNYSLTLTDTNNTLSDIKFSASGITVSRNGNKYTFTSNKMIETAVSVTAQKNVPGIDGNFLIWGYPGKQTMMSGAEDPVVFYLKIKTETTGVGHIVKHSEDGKVANIKFNIAGNGVNQTVTTKADGTVDVELMPGVYTVTELTEEKYEPQNVQRVTIVSGNTSTVTFSNTLKRGDLQVIKSSEDNLVEGVTFHLYGTSLSGISVDEYAVTDKNGVATFKDVLISGKTPYNIEEVDTANPILGDVKLSDLNTRMMEKYYQNLLKVKSRVVNNRKPNTEYLSCHTVREVHKLLRSAFNQAVKWELMTKNPCVNATLPQEEHKARDIWDAPTLFKALELCDDDILRLAINLAFSCSLRVGEMLGLTWDCVEISDASITNGTAFIFVNKELQRVNRDALEKLNEKGIILKFPAFFARTNTALVLKEPKTKTSTRKVFLPKTVAEMLKERYQEIQEYKELFGDEFQDFNLVFCNANGRPMESQIITRALQKLIKDNDLPPVVFHSLRHSSITYKLKLNGGDIKSVQGDSGHAQVKMVTDVYSHIIDEDRRLNAQRFEETFYQKKNPSEVNGATVEPKKEPQGITEEAMLNYMVQNPDFLQKFKVLLGVGN